MVIEGVYSPCYGKVEKLFVKESSYVYEWEKLALIETIDKQKVEIKEIGRASCRERV